MCEGTRENGTQIKPNDPIWEELNTAAIAAKSDPAAWLAQSSIYGELADEPAFADMFVHWLDLIWKEGCEAAIAEYTA